MNTTIKSAILAAGFLTATCVSGRAAEFNLDRLTAADVPAVNGVSPASGPGLREWTVMCYLVGNDTKLENAAVDTLNYLEFAGSSDKVAIVAELGRMKWQKPDDGYWQGSKRYYVEKDTDNVVTGSAIISKALAVMPGADMGDYKHLAEFITWARTNYPAKRYVLYLHGHGSGWKDPSKSRGIAFDSGSGHFISTPQLGQVFRLAGPVDIFFSVACVTQMAEVLYEIKDGVGYAVASEEANLAAYSRPDGSQATTAFEGYAVAAAFVYNPGLPTEMLAKLIPDNIDSIWKSFKIDERLTFSVVKTAALPALAARLDEWALGAEQLDDKAAAAAAKRAVLRFEQAGSAPAALANSYYADLKDFVSLYSGAVSAETEEGRAFRARSDALLDFLGSEVVLRNISFGLRDGADYARAGGLAITVPAYRPGSVDARLWTYEDLAFAKESSWDRFIFKYLWNIDNTTGFVPSFDARTARR